MVVPSAAGKSCNKRFCTQLSRYLRARLSSSSPNSIFASSQSSAPSLCMLSVSDKRVVSENSGRENADFSLNTLYKKGKTQCALRMRNMCNAGAVSNKKLMSEPFMVFEVQNFGRAKYGLRLCEKTIREILWINR